MSEVPPQSPTTPPPSWEERRDRALKTLDGLGIENEKHATARAALDAALATGLVEAIGRLVRSSDKNTDTMAGLTRAYVVLTFFLALTAVLQFWTMRAQNQMNEASIRVRERPWLATTSMLSAKDPNKGFGAIVGIKNFGSMPAREVELRVNVLTRPALETALASYADLIPPDRSEEDVIRERSRSVVAPGQEFSVGPILPEAGNQKEIETAARNVFTYGHVEYRDLRGEPHVTQFCFRYNAKTAALWTPCAGHNSVD